MINLLKNLFKTPYSQKKAQVRFKKRLREQSSQRLKVAMHKNKMTLDQINKAIGK